MTTDSSREEFEKSNIDKLDLHKTAQGHYFDIVTQLEYEKWETAWQACDALRQGEIAGWEKNWDELTRDFLTLSKRYSAAQAKIAELEAQVGKMLEELRYINEVSCGDCELMDVQDDTEAMAFINEHISEFLDKLAALPQEVKK